ncbi:uncharacterized protein LOC111446757 [Cucurbita moschata]|uniref:Uncharacterized protein LOC111446757 n=1 Tax=Cucurbita moschata TaxID=3662 RepID=A0A6J1FS69_CUCMO|nr:uncharacterized protein LOC111446757 [Cucurbita moschata]
MDEGEGGFGEGVDQIDQFHRNEAISAVADDGFLGEDEDEYEDLYNDVNVGEGFLQSLRKNEDLGFKNVEEPKREPPAAVAPSSGASIPGVGGGAMEVSGLGDGGPSVSVRPTEGYNQIPDLRTNEMAIRGGAGSGPPIGGGGGIRVELGQGSKTNELEERSSNNAAAHQPPQQQQQQQQHHPQPPQGGLLGNPGNVENEGLLRQGGGVNVNGAGGNGLGNMGNAGGGGGGGTILFVGDLHWWTTDAELEVELCKYGPLKEVKFFDEKASGKSKGYCQVEFYDSSAATACKEGMNGHIFNGRPCVVAFASPFSVKRMGEAQVNRNQQIAQATNPQARRGPNEAAGKIGGSNIATGGNYQGVDNNRGSGRGNWGRGNAHGMGGRGPAGLMRGRGGGMGGRGIMGNGGTGFGQGIGGTPPLLHPQSMMGQGFDPTFGAPMGRMGAYGGFPGAPAPPFSGILSSFPPVGGVGLPGVAPHVNPAFFGRGMPMNGMGMMPSSGVDGHNMGMWTDPSMGGWGSEEHGGGRAGESSYGEEAGSDQQYGEGSHERGAWANSAKEKDRGSERDWSQSSDRRYRDDRDGGYDRETSKEKDPGPDHDWPDRRPRDDRDIGRERDKVRDRDRERSRDHERGHHDRDRDRDRYKEDRDRYSDHQRYRDREPEHEEEWDRGRSSRTHSKSRLSQEEENRSRSKDADYGKRRRLTSE